MIPTEALQQLLQWNIRVANRENRAQARQSVRAVPMSAADRAQAIEDKRLARQDRDQRRTARKAAGRSRSR